MTESANASGPAFLGVECGATHSVALLVEGTSHRRLELGPANLQLVSDVQLGQLFREIRQWHSPITLLPHAIAIGMAGARTASDRQRIRSTAAST